ncbi:SPFH domain-containing protein [Verrucomicrobiales bacterium]|nr:SPFH domain-containing protein [Verrucomicrobiales bacterium]
MTKPGLNFISPWGCKVLKVSVKQQTIDISKTTVADGNGNPIIIGGVCTYKVTHAWLPLMSRSTIQAPISHLRQ